MEASGQLVTPQNNITIPSAAPKGIERPKSEEIKAPKVAPINRVGTISPPLYPAATQIQVKSIFKAKASGRKVPFSKICSIIFTPAPL